MDDLVSLISIPKTLLSLAGASGADGLQGEDLSQYWNGSGYRGSGTVFLQISESRVGRAIRTAEWKYAVKAPGGKGNDEAGSAVYEEEFLYDLTADPYEKNNRVADPALAAIRAGLAEQLKSQMAAAGEPMPEIRPAP